MDAEKRKLAGWTLLDALTELQDESGQRHVRSLAAVTSGQVINAHEIKNRQAAAWLAIADRLAAGELVAHGIRSASKGVVPISQQFSAAAKPNFKLNSLSLLLVTYVGVRLFIVEGQPAGNRVAVPPECSSPSEKELAVAKAQRPRQPSGLDFRKTDAKLVEKMHVMIEAGDARNATDAARALAKHAAGSGKESSKVTRLITRYTERFSPVQS